MVNKITLCILFSLQTVVLAQSKVSIIRNYTGKIGNYPIALQLEFVKGTDSLDGSYYYLKNGKDARLHLDGKRDKGVIQLYERDYGQRDKANEPVITGIFKLEGENVLKGLWKNHKTGKSLAVQLLSRQASNNIDSKDYSFKFGTYRAKILNAGGTEANYTKIRSLEIYENQKLHQRISGFDECVGKGNPELILEDLNFDGILDIKVPTYFPERTKYDGAFLYFLYNPANKKFELNKQMVDMEYLNFDPVNREVYKYGESAEGFVRNIFKWNRGNLVEVRTEPE